MSREQLNAAAQHFFQRILPAATGKRLADLQNPEVLLGAYRRHAGGPVQSFGRSITPQYMLKVGRTPLPIQSGSVALGTTPVGDDAADQPLVWMRFAADAKVDDQVTIRDLMGDLDTYAQRKFSVAGMEIDLGADAPVPPNSEQWSQAIQNNRAAIPDNLSTLTEVPEGLKSVAPEVHSLRMILGHFFTYDENGAYYPRWSGAGRQIPNDLSEPYRQNNVRELKLQREQLYLYMLAPKRLFTTEAAEAHDYREAVIRFDAIGDPSNPFLPTLVHSVYKRIETPHPFHDFVFFESEDGLGLPIPATARESISPAVTQFLSSIPENPADRARFFEKSKYVIAGDPPMVQLLATVEGELQLPPDVEVMASGEGPVYSVFAPPERVLEVAAHPSVKYLSLDGNPEQPTLDLALPVVDFSTFCAKFDVSKRDGEGVLVGIIDSGIDGKHPAFNDASGNSRIVAVWQQDEGRKGNAHSPAAKHPGSKAYEKFNIGKEYTGADVVNATDDPNDPGHGTHVAGIAAGAAVTHANGNVSRGVASKAKIVMVRAIGVNQGNVTRALAYIFQKATELSLPCVVNMSFGGPDNAHDGTDERARVFATMLRDPKGGNLLPGRILVASAGNERGSQTHVRREVKKFRTTILRHNVNHNNNLTATEDVVTIWIRTSASTKPDLWILVQHVPTGWTSNVVTLTTASVTQQVPARNLSVHVEYLNRDLHNSDYNLRVEFKSTGTATLPRREEWRILVLNWSDDIELHAWSARFIGRFLDVQPSDDSHLVGSPGSTPDVITVACSNSRLNWKDIDGTTQNYGETRLGDISSFSSPGPLRTCSERLLKVFGMTMDLTHPAIDVAAPGSAIVSALANNVNIAATLSDGSPNPNRSDVVNQNSWMMQGTSMAAPLVTGLVACILAEEPKLTQAEVLRRMLEACRLPAANATVFDPNSPDENDWGKGLLNAPRLKP